jgi:short-subunit dehydrogenase
MRKNILITGASSGLGHGMAVEFAKQGCNLALCARRVERLEELKAQLESINPVRCKRSRCGIQCV